MKPQLRLHIITLAVPEDSLFINVLTKPTIVLELIRGLLRIEDLIRF